MTAYTVFTCFDSRLLFFFSRRRRHTRFSRDWISDVCSSDLCRPRRRRAGRGSRDDAARRQRARIQSPRPLAARPARLQAGRPCVARSTDPRTPLHGRERRMTSKILGHVRALEHESIHIFREVAAEMRSPCLLFSGGKDSIIMLWLAVKAFAPARIPFPVMHTDTGLNFPEVLQFRDELVEELGLELVVASVQDAIDEGLVRQEPNGSRNRIQTPVLLAAAEKHGFDALFG